MTLKCLNTNVNKRFPQLAQSTSCVSINRGFTKSKFEFNIRRWPSVVDITLL